jgi:hypothetical protein
VAKWLRLDFGRRLLDLFAVRPEISRHMPKSATPAHRHGETFRSAA